MELIDVAEALVKKIKKDYPADISIVALCGSHIYHDTHSKSDLDFYFIPKTDRGYEMSECFILEDIGFDFWGMSWDRAESLAKYNGTNTSIISEAQIIYHASQDDLDRFDQLRLLGNTLKKSDFHSKATEQLNICYDSYFTMKEEKNNFSIVKERAMNILYYVSFAVALLNCSYVRRGGRNLLKEIMAMELVPGDFEELFNHIVLSNNADEIITSAKQVIYSLRQLIKNQEITRDTQFADTSEGYYEELKSIYNKLIHECETGNMRGIMLAIARIDRDVAGLLKGTEHDYNDFPNLFLISKKANMCGLIDAINTHEKQLVSLLENEGVKITRYNSFDDFCMHLNL